MKQLFDLYLTHRSLISVVKDVNARGWRKKTWQNGTGGLRCGRCGSVMTHSWTRRGNRLYRYYGCLKAQKQGRAACSTPSLPTGKVEAVIVEEI